MRLGALARYGLFLLALTALAVLPPLRAESAPYAAMVVDARDGRVLHARNADTRLHPASLTKMMTLYIAFEAVKNGEISLDTPVRISRLAASEPPSKLGLRSGQTIKLRYLIRAAAVKSANDAATAIGEAIEGSEAAFARRMNRTAKALGMTRTTFKNAHGLTESGHMSTARDMTTLGRQLLFDYPEYYNLFSRSSTNAGIREVANTNRRFLSSYSGADGIKTGYTSAAGFNLVASAKRGQERIITTVFGGVSSAARNAKVAELMDMGFSRAPSSVSSRRPPRPDYSGSSGATVEMVRAVRKSPVPTPRPWTSGATPEVPEDMILAIASDIKDALSTIDITPEAPDAEVVADLGPGLKSSPIPIPRPDLTQYAQASIPDPKPEVVTRLSTSGGRHWGINIGRFPTSYHAERELLKVALAEIGTLDEALRKVVKSSRGFEANFVGLSEETAALACRRLAARSVSCELVGPAS
jgi:D-alanyl-D-alanine carboxypeptidase